VLVLESTDTVGTGGFAQAQIATSLGDSPLAMTD
jgi:hypothetical protein